MSLRAHVEQLKFQSAFNKSMSEMSRQEGLINYNKEEIHNFFESHSDKLEKINNLLYIAIILLMIILFIQLYKIYNAQQIKKEQKKLSNVKSIIDLMKATDA